MALLAAGFGPSVAARFNPAEEDEAATRAGFADLFRHQGWDINAFNDQHLVLQRKRAPDLSIVACTLLPFEPRFELGHTLAEAAKPVTLDHPHCARFCVFGASSCMSAR